MLLLEGNEIFSRAMDLWIGSKQPFVFYLPDELEFHRHSCLRHSAYVICSRDQRTRTRQAAACMVYIRGPFFCPFYDVLSHLLWFLGDNFKGYTTELIFESFKRHLMTITCRVSIQSYRACHVLGHMPPKIIF